MMMRLMSTTMMRSRLVTASGVSRASCAALSGLSAVPLRTTLISEE